MKLQTKLIVAFSVIVIIMSFLQAIYFQKNTEKIFEDYVRQSDNGPILFWKNYLLDYYQYYGTLDGIQPILATSTGFKAYRGGRNNNQGFFGMSNFTIIVADEDGIVIGATEEELLGAKAEKIPGVHEDLIISNKKVGELIVSREKSKGIITLEQQFINSVNKSLLFGASISVIIAVIFGAILSDKITKPLEKLMVGINQLTKGNKSYRVSIKTKDEFSHLANAFNEMSTKLEQNEEIRRNLVADVAHELRTPLSVLRGRMELIQEGTIEPTQEVIVQLNDEIYHLTILVNDLQQLSLAEAGKLHLNKTSVNVNELLQKIISNFKWLAEEKNIDLTFKEEIGDVFLYIDADRITQVIVNIIGNALRYTPETGDVTIEMIDKEQNVVIKIKDSGPGIPAEQLPYIFDRFYRTDSSRSRDRGGAGLGLAIAKGFIEAHGGTITVESDVGKGTTFSILLPYKLK